MIIGLFKTIFFLITFYYLFKIIGRLVLPYVMKKGFEKMQQQQQQNGSGAFREKAKQEEGKVTIKTNAQKKESDMSANDGEYVDFEEVK